MAVTFDEIGPNGVNPASGTANYSILLPPNIVSTDILVVVFRTLNQTLTTPTGWTLLGETQGYSDGGTTTNTRQYMYGKNTPSPADSSTTVTFVGGTVNGPAIHYSSIAFHVTNREGAFVSPSSTAVTTNASSGVVIPSVTATNNFELFVTGITMNGLTTGSLSVPGGLTNVNGYSKEGAVFYQERSNGQSNTSGAIGWGLMSDTSSSAVVARFALTLTPALLTDGLGTNDSSAVGWNLQTTLSDAGQLVSEALLGKNYADSLADALAVYPVTGAIDPVFSLVNLSEGLGLGHSAVEAAQRQPMVDPSSGRDIFINFSGPNGRYVSADSAYNQWATSMGVSTSDTDVSLLLQNRFANAFIPLGFSPVYFSAAARIFVSATGNICLYKNTSFDTSYETANIEYGDVFWAAANHPTVEPMLTFGISDSTFQYMSLSLFKCKIDSINKVAIFNMVFVNAGAQPDLIRLCFKLQPGYIEIVSTPEGVLQHGHQLQYMIANEDTGFVGFTRVLSYDLSDTLSYASDDISYRLIDVEDTINMMGPSNSRVASKWIATAGLADESVLRDIDLSVAYPRTALDTMSMGDTSTHDIRYGAFLVDVLRVLDTQVLDGKFSTSTADTVRLVDVFRRVFPVSQSESLAVADITNAMLGVRVLEALGLLDSAIGKATLYRTVANLLRINDSLRRFLGGAAADTISVAQSQATHYNLSRQLAETVGILPALSTHLLIRVDLAEQVGIDDAQILKLIFNGQVVEGVQLSAAYISPNNSVTAWAVNTRTGATTEYTNFDFNSFARAGHKYLGASASGLFELNGDDDDGDPTIARIKSGYAQFNGSRYTAFKAAYLGMRAGAGDFYFKIDAGDGASYTYKVVAQNMQTTKVQLGKGLRARYFAYELTSTGQDFDLDTVEFVPMTAQRRV